MKGEILYNLLNLVQDAIDLGGDLAYIGAHAAQIYHHRERFIPEERVRREFEQKQRRLFQKLLSKLISDGLIVNKQKDNGVFCYLTKLGKAKLKRLKASFMKGILPRPQYPKENSTSFTIVTFDIREREQHKRSWLRRVLKNLRFTMLQKSVWIGKVKIPEQLLADLYQLDLLRFIEILEITKSGTLRNIS